MQLGDGSRSQNVRCTRDSPAVGAWCSLAEFTTQSRYTREQLAHARQSGLRRVFVWGAAMAGLLAAAALTGTDCQWDAYARLLSEIADDIAGFEEEKKGAQVKAASVQTAIVNGWRRLERVVTLRPVPTCRRCPSPTPPAAAASGSAAPRNRRGTDHGSRDVPCVQRGVQADASGILAEALGAY